MRRGRRHKRMGSMSIICVTTIITLSSMGVGYGVWNDNINLGVNLTTGNIDPEFNVGDSYANGLSFSSSDDGRILYISGEVYPNFNDNIPIKIVDKGSIPVILYDIDVVNADEIAGLEEAENSNKLSRVSFMEEDVVKTFQLNINSDNNDNTIMQRSSQMNIEETYDIQDGITDIQLEIYNIQEEINDIQKEIERLNIVEDHNFTYELQFEQGI